MRPLTLHASALNDDEYNIYTSSILDLALYDSNHSEKSHTRGDTFYEQIIVSVRETRAWLRGRYPDIQVSTIDAILKLFSPTLSQGDILSGGQFFAVLRLVMHAQNGREVDRSLAFVQARPPCTSSMIKSSSDRGPPNLSRRSEDSSTSPEPGPPLTNPFSYQTGQQPPIHPSQRQETSETVLSPNNPFISRNKSKSEDGPSRIPPLPPRKPSAPTPPPRHVPVSPPHLSRLQLDPNNTLRTSPSSMPHPHLHPLPPAYPPLPPKNKPVTHVTSNLMKQSLQASKTAQNMKKAEEQLEKERVLQVLRSSAVVSGAHVRPPTFSARSRSPSKRLPTSPASMSVASSSAVAKSDSSASWSGSDDRERERPPLPRRRHQQPSPPISNTSLEQVALAVAPSGGRSQPPSSYTSSPFESPTHSPHTRQTVDLPGVAGLPPPTHPGRKPFNLTHQLPVTQAEEVVPSSSTLSSHRKMNSFEVIYGISSEPSPSTSAFSAETPSTPTQPALMSDSLTSSSSPQQRVYRSKSLHHHPHPNLPPPPPTRRKRPESIQILPNGEVLFGPTASPRSVSAAASSSTFDSQNALKTSMSHTPSSHRRSSHTSSFGGSASSSTALGTGASGSSATVISGSGSGADIIQRRIAELQMRAENALPVLEKARYKAEAGLSRRGFIQGSGLSDGSCTGQRSRSRGTTVTNGKEDRERLMSGYCDDQYGADEGEGDADGEYSGGMDSGDDDGPRGRDKGTHLMALERDALKWPVGEGWKML